VAGYERIRSSINLLKFHVTQFCSTYVVLRQIRFGLLLGRVCDQLRWELDRQTLRKLGERRWHRDLWHLRVSVRVWMRVTVSVRVEVKLKVKIRVRVRVRGQGSPSVPWPISWVAWPWPAWRRASKATTLSCHQTAASRRI
jgi:hypothetical protein